MLLRCAVHAVARAAAAPAATLTVRAGEAPAGVAVAAALAVGPRWPRQAHWQQLGPWAQGGARALSGGQGDDDGSRAKQQQGQPTTTGDQQQQTTTTNASEAEFDDWEGRGRGAARVAAARTAADYGPPPGGREGAAAAASSTAKTSTSSSSSSSSSSTGPPHNALGSAAEPKLPAPPAARRLGPRSEGIPGSEGAAAAPRGGVAPPPPPDGDSGGVTAARRGVRSVGASGGGTVEWSMAAAAATAASWTSRGGSPRPPRGAGGAGGPGPGTGTPFRLVQKSGGVETVVSVQARGPGDLLVELIRRNASPHAGDDGGGATGGPNTTKFGGGGAGSAPAKRSNALQLALRRTYKQLQNTFLPSGYPTSVGPHYLQYSLWQAATNVATTANGVLASTFLLYSVGLGAGAIPTAGALNWVVKDGLGQLGTLLFGKAIAHNFDIHSKSWYFLSFVLLSTANGMEIATILVPKAFLVLGSCANMIKGLSWMAGGSTRSVFNLSFVRDNNIADITAKNTSQYIFASLFGTAFGVSICAYIGQSATLALACFSLLTGTAMYSAFRTVQAIPLPTLNSTRLQLLTGRYLKCVRRANTAAYGGGVGGADASAYINYQREYEVPDDEESACARQLPTPLELAEEDPPLPWFMGDQRILNPDIRVGTAFDTLVAGNPDLMVTLMTTFRYSRYLLLPTRDAIHLVLHQEAQPRDIVTAYLQACILRKRLKTGLPASSDNLPELRIILHDTMLTAEKLTGPLMAALSRQGWQTEKIVVEAHRRRARW